MLGEGNVKNQQNPSASMMAQNLYKEQTFRLEVNSSGQQIDRSNLQLDTHAEEVVGICVSSDRGDLAFFRGLFHKIDIDGREWVRDYDASMLISNASVAPDNKYKSVDALPNVGGKMLRVNYQDQDHPEASFSPYKVRVHVKLKMKQRD